MRIQRACHNEDGKWETPNAKQQAPNKQQTPMFNQASGRAGSEEMNANSRENVQRSTSNAQRPMKMGSLNADLQAPSFDATVSPKRPEKCHRSSAGGFARWTAYGHRFAHPHRSIQ